MGRWKALPNVIRKKLHCCKFCLYYPDNGGFARKRLTHSQVHLKRPGDSREDETMELISPNQCVKPKYHPPFDVTLNVDGYPASFEIDALLQAAILHPPVVEIKPMSLSWMRLL